MIPRLSVDTYAAAFDLGAAVEARAVGQVVQSRRGWVVGRRLGGLLGRVA